MRVQTSSAHPAQPTYPTLIIHKSDLTRPDPLIVYAIHHGEGIIISQNKNAGELVVGANFKTVLDALCVDIKDFVEYKGTITLSN